MRMTQPSFHGQPQSLRSDYRPHDQVAVVLLDTSPVRCRRLPELHTEQNSHNRNQIRSFAVQVCKWQLPRRKKKGPRPSFNWAQISGLSSSKKWQSRCSYLTVETPTKASNSIVKAFRMINAQSNLDVRSYTNYLRSTSFSS